MIHFKKHYFEEKGQLQFKNDQIMQRFVEMEMKLLVVTFINLIKNIPICFEVENCFEMKNS